MVIFNSYVKLPEGQRVTDMSMINTTHLWPNWLGMVDPLALLTWVCLCLSENRVPLNQLVNPQFPNFLGGYTPVLDRSPWHDGNLSARLQSQAQHYEKEAERAENEAETWRHFLLLGISFGPNIEILMDMLVDQCFYWKTMENSWNFGPSFNMEIFLFWTVSWTLSVPISGFRELLELLVWTCVHIWCSIKGLKMGYD